MNFEQTEQACCPRCEGAIPQEAIRRRPIDLDRVVMPTHELLGYCEHCDALWRAKRRLMPGGQYEFVEPPSEITDERVKRPMVNQIRAKRGHTPLHA